MNRHTDAMPNELLRLQKMHNGEKVQPTFSAPEMQRRQDGLRKINAEGIGSLTKGERAELEKLRQRRR